MHTLTGNDAATLILNVRQHREKARGSLGRKTYLARPHAERAELVHAEYGWLWISYKPSQLSKPLALNCS